MHPLEEVNHAVEHQEEIAPADQLLGPAQPQLALRAAADKQLVNALLVGNLS